MGDLKQDLAGTGLALVETHTAWVFLGDGVVWKVKKPVDFGFLDFTTIEKRKAACDAEVQLNARLAPHVYRGVVPVTFEDGRHRIAGGGRVVDWAVEMVRLSDSDRADVRMEAGRLEEGQVDRLSEHLARFHEKLAPEPAIARFGAPEVILANVRENFAQTRATITEHLSPRDAEAIEAAQLGFLSSRRELFEERMRKGRIRDGHGDLRLEHVYFDSREPDAAPTIIDCIEFNERFRYADVCSDVAFLAMDFARLGRADLAERFLAGYARASNDYDLYRLVDFYAAYRAYVRGKVASLLAADAGASSETRQRARHEARRDYLLSLSALGPEEARRPRLVEPALIAVGGLIASGKSTVAARIASLVGGPVVDADRTRKWLAGVEATTPLSDAAWTGNYSDEFTQRVYGEVLRRAACVLDSGRSVVVDASFRSRALRTAVRDLAREKGVRFHFVECRVTREESLRRLARRAEAPSVSDGRSAIFDDFAARFEPVNELTESEHLVLDTSLPPAETEHRLRERLPCWPPGLTR